MLENDSQMFGQAFADTLERYLGETLHVSVKVGSIQRTISVPFFLERAYRFYEAWIAGIRCIVMAARENSATPGDIAKHVMRVRSAVDDIVIFATPSLSAHNRGRLIAQGVPFIVPGNQLYLPELAMDLREHFRLPRLQAVDSLSPVAQAVLFLHLLKLDEFAIMPSVIAERLHYSPMSIGRAFDELVSARLATTEKRGKERHIQFDIQRQELLETARPLLRSPVRSVKCARGGAHPTSELKLAGQAALARLTDLTPPRKETFAIAASDWKTVSKIFDLTEVNEFEADFTVEIWSYNPSSLSDRAVVDPLSLYAQFWDHRDERIAMAVERLLEDEIW